ncbi:WXG100 family type VII secretion target [Actinomyces sp. 2119]|nr:WXG100 family type VII secretion target [Actinomyces sp. 2119]
MFMCPAFTGLSGNAATTTSGGDQVGPALPGRWPGPHNPMTHTRELNTPEKGRASVSENLAAGSGTLVNAANTVSTHRAEQKTIASRVSDASAQSQAGWKGVGATAVTQVVTQWMEAANRIDRALNSLEEALRSTDKSYQATEEEAASAAAQIGASVGTYHGLPG